MRKRFATPSGFRRTARLAAAILAIVLAAPLGAAADDVVINKTISGVPMYTAITPRMRKRMYRGIQ